MEFGLQKSAAKTPKQLVFSMDIVYGKHLLCIMTSYPLSSSMMKQMVENGICI